MTIDAEYVTLQPRWTGRESNRRLEPNYRLITKQMYYLDIIDLLFRYLCYDAKCSVFAVDGSYSIGREQTTMPILYDVIVSSETGAVNDNIIYKLL
jgi:hypothetical protein